MAGSFAELFAAKGIISKEQAKKVEDERKQKAPKQDYSKCDGTDKRPSNKARSGGSNNGGNNRGGNGGYGGARSGNEATAPYNFVPLAGKAVQSPLGVYLDGDFSKYGDYIAEQGKFSGTIDLTITTLTPTCINADSKFYAPNGKPVIPGSTLRGLVKNYLKIISCGTLRAEGNEDMTSRHLYYRGLASKCKEFRTLYSGKMTEAVQRKIDGQMQSLVVSKAKAGFLARLEDNSYVIYPADFKTIPYKRATNPNGTYKFEMTRDGRKQYQYLVPREIEYKIIPSRDKVECHTGPMRGKGHYYVLSNVAWDKPLKVLPATIEEYKGDKTRKGKDLFAKDSNIASSDFARGHKFQFLAPCFYLDEAGEVLHFGYGKYYRIPYDKAVEEHVPEAMRDPRIIDFAEALFGRKEDFASRVSFEDAKWQKGGELLHATKSHNLMGPNPTSFQLYLEQDGRGMKHWDNNTNIRGYKLYWHQNIGPDEWCFGSGDKDVKGTMPIEPIGKDAVFTGRIRFENLSAAELGALLKTLELGQKGRFKVGMGKPLGMGSIKVESRLQLINATSRYQSLFAESKWQTGVINDSGANYVQAFTAYMQQATQSLGISQAYQSSLATLTLMLDWGQKPKDRAQTAYMPIGDRNDRRYQDRAILPKPEEVVGRRR